jgi:hypothetical protein
MTTTTTTPLAAMQAAAEASRAEADAKLEALVIAEREADQRRRQLHRDAWQTWLDGYDPAALARDAVDTRAALERALLETDLGRAMVNHLAAVRRRGAYVTLAREAVRAGATTTASTAHVIDEFAGDAGHYIARLLPHLALDVAMRIVDGEQAQVQGSAQAAYDSVSAKDPVAYRIESPMSEDYTDVLGGEVVPFVAGVAYLPAGDGRIAHYERGEQYRVTPVFGIPSTHAAAEARMRAQTAGDVRIGLPIQDGGRA